MAIKLKDQYPGPNQTIVSPEWPEGGPNNSSVAGAYDGTPEDQEWKRDIWGFLERLREVDGFTPNGTPDNALSSQRYDALMNIARNIWPVWGGVNPQTDTYVKGAVVIASDGKTYQSLIASNFGNDPVSSPSQWEYFRPVAVIDNLLSASSLDALSANQGRLLKEQLDLIPIAVPATVNIKGLNFLRRRIIGSMGVDADHDINTSAGNFLFADDSGSAYAPAFTKKIDAVWSSGTSQGGLAAGVSLLPDTTYHYFALSNTAGDVVDFGFDGNASAANLRVDPNVVAYLGSNCKYERQLSVVTNSLSNIRPFYQIGTRFYWKEQVLDVYDFGNGTTATLDPLTVPTGIEVNADVDVSIGNALSPFDNVFWFLITSPDDVDNIPTQELSTFGFLRGDGGVWGVCLFVKTDISAQIRWRHTATVLRSDAFGWGLRIWSRGWHDFKLEN